MKDKTISEILDELKESVRELVSYEELESDPLTEFLDNKVGVGMNKDKTKTIDYRQFLAIELFGGKIEIIRLKSIKRLEVDGNVLRVFYTDSSMKTDSFITNEPLTMDDVLEMMI